MRFHYLLNLFIVVVLCFASNLVRATELATPPLLLTAYFDNYPSIQLGNGDVFFLGNTKGFIFNTRLKVWQITSEYKSKYPGWDGTRAKIFKGPNDSIVAIYKEILVIYDLKKDVWKTRVLKKLPKILTDREKYIKLSKAFVALNDGRIIRIVAAAAGIDQTYADIYNLTKNEWSEVKPPPRIFTGGSDSLELHSILLSNGNVLVVQQSPSLNVYHSAVYHVESNHWEETKTFDDYRTSRIEKLFSGPEGYVVATMRDDFAYGSPYRIRIYSIAHEAWLKFSDYSYFDPDCAQIIPISEKKLLAIYGKYLSYGKSYISASVFSIVEGKESYSNASDKPIVNKHLEDRLVGFGCPGKPYLSNGNSIYFFSWGDGDEDRGTQFLDITNLDSTWKISSSFKVKNERLFTVENDFEVKFADSSGLNWGQAIHNKHLGRSFLKACEEINAKAPDMLATERLIKNFDYLDDEINCFGKAIKTIKLSPMGINKLHQSLPPLSDELYAGTAPGLGPSDLVFLNYKSGRFECGWFYRDAHLRCVQ